MCVCVCVSVCGFGGSLQLTKCGDVLVSAMPNPQELMARLPDATVALRELMNQILDSRAPA